MPPEEGGESKRGQKRPRSADIAARITAEGAPPSASLVELLLVFSDRTKQFVLVSGEAGTGKTRLLQDFRTHLRLRERSVCVAVTAPTGVAAVSIAGTTLHSFLGMGLLDGTIEQILKKGLSRKCREALRKTDVLIIDEISMVEPSFLERIESLARHVRLGPGNKGLPLFGGMRIFMFGDFMQLPPIHRRGTKTKYVFQTEMWHAMGVLRLRLNKVHRQSDGDFLRVLKQIRQGQLSPEVATLLAVRVREESPSDLKCTRLCSYRNRVETYNRNRLADIDGETTVMSGFFDVRRTVTAGRSFSLAKKVSACEKARITGKVKASFDNRFPVPLEVEMKEGAQVMMRNNQHIDQGVCNGSVGTVVNIGGNCVTVDFDGTTLALYRYAFLHRFSKEHDVVLYQFPLMLAWAITIHKSQGMTLSGAYIDADCFEYGQLYTALSRVRNLETLFLAEPITKRSVLVNEDALEFELRPCLPI